MKHSHKRNDNSTGQTLDVYELNSTLSDQKREIVQAQMAAVKQLAGGVSHHFNNALQVILTAAELAAQHPDVPTSVKNDLLAIIIKQSQEAAQLNRQLLDFSRQSIGGKQPVDLVNIIRETMEQLKSSFPESIQMSLTVDKAQSTSYIVKANPAQMRQGLTNLAANARDAMPTGGELRLRISTLESEKRQLNSIRLSGDQWIVLSVSDTGLGMPDDILPYIFEPFFTTKEVGQGAGLGLAQVYGIIQQMEGKIEVESQVGKGTIFLLYFPALPQLWKGSDEALKAKQIEQHDSDPVYFSPNGAQKAAEELAAQSC